MHPVLLFALQGLSILSNPAPTDSVLWLPVFYDNFYALPHGAPTWSPDDEQVAVLYSELPKPFWQAPILYILQRDGTWFQCTPPDITWGAAWSPLGGEIATTTGTKIVILSPDNCGYVREIATPFAGSDPKWSRDGRRIVFSVRLDQYAAIYTASAAGGNVQPVVYDGDHPDWSPDGASIVFVRAGNLWIISADGTNERQITHLGKDDWPAWSRDGNHLAFTRSDPLHMGVWLVGVNGGPATQVTPFVEGEAYERPCWSHDGSRLTYFVIQGDRIGVGIMRDVIPLAVETRTWSTLKKTFR